MQTGVHEWLLNNKPGWILFDTLFYSMPLVYFLCYKYLSKASARALMINGLCFMKDRQAPMASQAFTIPVT